VKNGVRKPVIASDVSALNTQYKGAGLLFKAGDEKQLAYEIGKLLSDKDDYQDRVGKGLERAKQYDIHFMIDRHMELYKKLLMIKPKYIKISGVICCSFSTYSLH
jgi:glycosyltransferase involved in cell wall biosynthesis